MEKVKDTIYRQDAIDAVISLCDDCDSGHCGSCRVNFEGVKDARKVLKELPSAQSEIVRCKDCIHRPIANDTYNFDDWNCGFDIEFPDYRCPCRCDDEYYNRIPDDDWFCGNAERRIDD